MPAPSRATAWSRCSTPPRGRASPSSATRCSTSISAVTSIASRPKRRCRWCASASDATRSAALPTSRRTSCAIGAECDLVAASATTPAGRQLSRDAGRDRRPSRDPASPSTRPTTTKTRIVARVAAARPRRRRGGRGPRRRRTSRASLAAIEGAIARRRRAGPRGLQQGRARPARDRRARSRLRARAGIPIVVDPEVPQLLRVSRRDDLQAQPARARVGARRRGGPRAPRGASRDVRAAWRSTTCCSRWASAAWCWCRATAR